MKKKSIAQQVQDCLDTAVYKEEAIEYLLEHSETSLAAARRNKNIKVVTPDDYTLRIDIDNEHDWGEFKSVLEIFSKHMKINYVNIWESRSGRPYHYHITVTLKDKLTIWQRLAFQACLGSHRHCEILSSLSVYHNIPDPIVYFERADK